MFLEKIDILFKHVDLLIEKRDSIVDKWLAFDEVITALDKHHIKTDYFKQHFASQILDYYIGVIKQERKIGDCPVMGEYLVYLHDHNVLPHELYIICTHFRRSLIDFIFDEDISSRELFDQISFVVDSNITGVLMRFKQIMSGKDNEIRLQTHMMNEYHRVINEGTIVSRGDLSGKITYVNEKFCEISGYTPEELIGKPHSIIRHPDTPSHLFQELWKAAREDHIWSGVIKNRKKDGSDYHVSTSIFPIHDSNGKIIEFLSIRQDITEKVNLYSELEETQKEIIYKMGEVGETRSEETGNHVKRVAKYSYLLALKAGLSEQEANILQLASPMHDIGKVGISDEILKKKGPLSESEWVTMKTHAKVGYNILKTSSRSILKTAAIVAHQHHEKWDGNGYPQGLSGNDIHIYGRITAIADVFDALGSNRVYKKAWELDKILELFSQERGKHFDPSLIDLFLQNLDEILKVRDQYQDV